MGRHNKTPRLAYLTKADRAQKERQARNQRYQAFDSMGKEIHKVLHKHGQEVLELAGKGFSVDDTEYTNKILGLFIESDVGMGDNSNLHSTSDSKLIGRR